MAEAMSFPTLRSLIRAKKPPLLTVAHGEEGYFIDEIAREFETLVPQADRDFCLHLLYAAETEPRRVVEVCRSFPFMGDRQVVIVKEAQSWTANDFNALAAYWEKPSGHTSLLVCCRGKAVSGANFLAALRKQGVNFESKKVRDERSAGPLVRQFITSQGLGVEEKALEMLTEFVGTDLSRLYKEVEKLTLSLGKGATVTPEAVERNIGVSKDYNNNEFISAIAAHNAEKVMKIYRYFHAAPKNHPPQMLVAWIFPLFADLLTALYAPDKSDAGLMAALNKKSSWGLRDIRAAMQHYNAWQTIDILGAIRRFDCASKGNGSRQDAFDLLFDLLQRILYPLGASGVKL